MINKTLKKLEELEGFFATDGLQILFQRKKGVKYMKMDSISEGLIIPAENAIEFMEFLTGINVKDFDLEDSVKQALTASKGHLDIALHVLGIFGITETDAQTVCVELMLEDMKCRS